MRPLRVGDVLCGFCGGSFGRDSYDDKRVEAIGSDWVVVRSAGVHSGPVEFYEGDPDDLTQYALTDDNYAADGTFVGPF